MLLAIALCVLGLALVLISAERLVDGTVQVAQLLRVSPFVISVIMLGFDPENLAVGVAGSAQQATGLASGTILGSAMIAVALAPGVAAVFAPMRFSVVSYQVLALCSGSVLLMGMLSLDGQLSRIDGLVLLAAYPVTLVLLARLGRQGLDVRSVSERVEIETSSGRRSRRAIVVLGASLAGIVIGSELLVSGVKSVVADLHLSQTAVGMTLLAAAISVEELARTVPAAIRGHYEISIGNLVGSALAFFLFNAGAIAVVNPLHLDAATRHFYLPYTAATVVAICAVLLLRRLPRWAGIAMILAYAGFLAGAAQL